MRYFLSGITGYAMSAMAWVSSAVVNIYSFSELICKTVVFKFLDACFSMPAVAKEGWGFSKASLLGRTWEPKVATNYRGNKNISIGTHIHSNSLCM